MSQHIISTDKSTKESLDEQAAKAFYACNISFNVADHPQFKKMISMLRPGYESPSRKELAGHILDNVHDHIIDEMKTELSGKDVTLVQDGWSDIHNSPVIASSIHTSDKSYFLSAVETGSNKKTSAYCASLAKTSMGEASATFECNVTAVVTDNEKKMDVVRKQLKDDMPDLTVYGCSSHIMNLLGQDLTPNAIISQIVEVNKYFRNHHVPGALLAEFKDLLNRSCQIRPDGTAN